MIQKPGHSTQQLLDYHDGKIKSGLGVGVKELDLHLRFKRGQLNVILGHDNIGKTAWCLWYFLCLSSYHNITWTLYLAENKSWQALRDLIQMYSGKQFKDLTKTEISTYQMIIEQWFQFVDNSKLYTPEDLIKLFEESESDAFFIDPFTALDRQFGYEANYRFLNQVRQFCNLTGKTLYLSSHPISDSGRSGGMYPKGHDWEGYMRPPYKSEIEGGKAFANRVDDFIILHRMTDHEGDMRYKTMLIVSKVKDLETGGRINHPNNPVLFDWNSGLGFKCGFDEGINRSFKVKTENDLPF